MAKKSNKKPKNPDLLDIAQAAKLLYVHPGTLRRWESAGLLFAYRVGVRGDRRFRREDIEAFLE